MPTAKLHLPRRHRRPLLFPPGLLALAWLLWLGCVALPQMRGMERPLQSVLQITAVPLHLNEGWPLELPVYSSEQQLAAYRNWKTVTFTGNIFNDYFSLSQAKKAAEFVRTDSTFQAGMQVRFANDASYASFVYAIDLLYQQDFKRWWLDIQHHPTTLYAFVKRHTPAIPIFVCGNLDYRTSLQEPSSSHLLIKFFQPDWRNSTLLLLLMTLLSAVQLGRRWWLG
jgi:hypothetical protein